ncbi:MAG TPA: ATP-binding cassette domain-containing protein [Rhizomicrobium sp.]|nr:ATP-binding cassette domain-containing protein [Rhizomicrobium sp.]
MTGPILLVEQLGYRWGKPSSAWLLQGLSLEIAENERVALLGRSGVGKTTFAKIVAGLIPTTTGSVTFPQAESDRRPVDIAFQGNVLFPWLSVWENVAFGVPVRAHRATNKEGALAILDTVGLRGAADFMPNELSGGMRQRVSVARAIFRRSQLTILDEPFSSLDLVTREALYELVRSTSTEQRMAYLIVTHLPEDAYYSCTRSFVLSGKGRKLNVISHADYKALAEYRTAVYERLQE